MRRLLSVAYTTSRRSLTPLVLQIGIYLSELTKVLAFGDWIEFDNNIMQSQQEQMRSYFARLRRKISQSKKYLDTKKTTSKLQKFLIAYHYSRPNEGL